MPTIHNGNVYTVYRHIFPNGKSYVGISACEDIEKKRYGANGRLYGHLVGDAIKEFGWENVEHEIIESQLDYNTANEREKYYIKYFNSQYPSGYNITDGGKGRTGYKRPPVSQETRDRISKSKTGVKLGSHSDEWNKHISEAKKLSDYKHSDETKRKISEHRKGITHSEESKRKIGETVKKKQLYKALLTEESRKKAQDKTCLRIEYLDDCGNVIKTFKTGTECAQYFNCSLALISNIVHHKCKYPKYNLRRINGGNTNGK